MWLANIIGGAAVFLLGVATTATAWLTLPYTGEFGPGPGFVPFWLGLTLTVCSIPSLLRTSEDGEVGEAFPTGNLAVPQGARLIVLVFLSLPILGFSAGLALITGGGMRLMGKHSWVACAATVIGRPSASITSSASGSPSLCRKG